MFLVTLHYHLTGMGPMPWTVNSEIYPLWARSTGNACSAGVNWTFNVLVSLTFLHMAQYLTYYGNALNSSVTAVMNLTFLSASSQYLISQHQEYTMHKGIVELIMFMTHYYFHLEVSVQIDILSTLSWTYCGNSSMYLIEKEKERLSWKQFIS